MRSKWQRILVTTAMGIGLSAQLAAAREPGCGGRSHDVKSSTRLRMVGLTAEQRLVHFRECNPERTKSAGAVSGLVGDTALIGIDFRVQNGKLYGVGNAGGVYIVDPVTAVATLDSQLTVALSGTTFGVDFNPAADRLRVLSDTGQNLRHDLNTDTTTLDTGLAYVPAAVATIAAGAYTNNDLDPTTATTLFDVDTNLDQIAVITGEQRHARPVREAHARRRPGRRLRHLHVAPRRRRRWQPRFRHPHRVRNPWPLPGQSSHRQSYVDRQVRHDGRRPRHPTRPVSGTGSEAPPLRTPPAHPSQLFE